MRALPPETKKEALNFGESLGFRQTPTRERESPKGMWADLNNTLTDEEIAGARCATGGHGVHDRVTNVLTDAGKE